MALEESECMSNEQESAQNELECVCSKQGVALEEPDCTTKV